MSDTAHHDGVESVVLADVGGTNVRLAVLAGGTLGPIEHMAVHDHQRFTDALTIFMARQREHATIRKAILAVAGVVTGERCVLTNSPWVVDAADLRARFGFVHVEMINDFEAIAWSLPHLARDNLRRVGGREPAAGAPMVALGPGTGLGVAAYVRCAPAGLVLRSEGGHTTVPSGSLREDTIIENSAAALRARLRRTGVVGAWPRKSLSRHRFDRWADRARAYGGRDHPGRSGKALSGKLRRA